MGDKTRKLYTMNPKAYKKKTSDEVTRFYRKVPTLHVKEINNEARDITAKMDISDKIQTISEKKAFLTVKDYKDNFYRYSFFFFA